MAEQPAPVTAIVVNYNSGAALCDCVGAVLEDDPRAEVVVVDNASEDESIALLEQRFRSRRRLHVYRNTENLGFARAVNARAREASSDFLLVLNPDCVLASGALPALTAVLAGDPRAGLAAPRVLQPDGRIEAASLRHFPKPWNSLVTVTGVWRLGRWVPGLRGVPAANPAEVTETVEAEAVSGACMLIRKRALEKVGYFDEAYPLHCEDLDLMRRLALTGWRCLYVPSACATHRQGLSSRSRPLWVHRQKHRGMARFYRKFLAEQYPRPLSWLVTGGIWLHYLVLLPVVWLRR